MPVPKVSVLERVDCIPIVCFSQTTTSHPWRPKGSQSGRKKLRARRKFTSTCNGSGNAGSWTGRKNALHYCAQSAWVLFVSSYMTAFVSPFLFWQSSAYKRQSNAPGSHAYNRQGKFLQLIATEFSTQPTECCQYCGQPTKYMFTTYRQNAHNRQSSACNRWSICL